MRFFGLIGKTLEHSFSPEYFKNKFEREGLSGVYYQLFPLQKIDQFNQLITDYTELSGLNVTIPYKQEIIPFLDEIDTNAQEIGAVNTIKFSWINNKLHLTGYNTDYLGFMDSITPLLKSYHKKALILGTGGSSKAVEYAFKISGIKTLKVSRDFDNSQTVSYKDLNADIFNDYKIIVNTTPLGMYPNIEAFPDIPFQFITDKHLVYDLIYNPPITRFLERAKQQGAYIKNGQEMLEKQAEYSWKIWNNIPY